MSKLIALGSDYECFIQNSETDALVSAVPIIPYDDVDRLDCNVCQLHHDNVLAEVNTRPAYTKDEWNVNVRDSLNVLRDYLQPKGLRYVLLDHAFMPEEELRTPEAEAFGCMPDLDVFSQKEQIPPSALEAGTFRSAGGHIHVSYTFATRAEQIHIARILSLALSLTTTAMGDTAERRKLYGQPGRVRMKDYGIEVRTPSNIWLRYESWINHIWLTAHVAVGNDGALHRWKRSLGSNHVHRIYDAIRTADQELCRDMLRMANFMRPYTEEDIREGKVREPRRSGFASVLYAGTHIAGDDVVEEEIEESEPDEFDPDEFIHGFEG